MLELMVEDQAAYEALTAAKKLPADAPQRMPEIEEATMICVAVPQAMAGTAVAMLELANDAGGNVNRLSAVGFGGLRGTGDGDGAGGDL